MEVGDLDEQDDRSTDGERLICVQPKGNPGPNHAKAEWSRCHFQVGGGLGQVWANEMGRGRTTAQCRVNGIRRWGWRGGEALLRFLVRLSA